MRKFLILTWLCITSGLTAQEFVCDVTVNAQQTGQPNLSVFRTLETSLEEFVNQNKWTAVDYLPQEKIDCSFFINISSFNNTSFTATLQVQASRPVFDSGYKTTIANFNDANFSFEYQEYQPLEYNENAFQGNLIAVVTYYLYTVLGLQADSFEPNGGTEYFQTANQIVGLSQSSGFQGWSNSSATQSRFRFNTDILSGTFTDFRTAFYDYHRLGLDVMSEKPKEGKKQLQKVIETLSQVNRKRPNSYLLRSFFDAKNIEIVKILSGGPKMNVVGTVNQLSNLSPTYNEDWLKIIE